MNSRNSEIESENRDPNEELQRWRARAQAVSIVRDDWGVAHIRGATDADAVFGLIYAQSEDDFNRVEANYLSALGRRAEAEGESAIYFDLRLRLFVDPEDLKRRYLACTDELKALMEAWADGLNYFLSVNPQAVPRVIRRYEPWMALSFVEGGILGDIARVNVSDLEAFYRNDVVRHKSESKAHVQEVVGSNAFAVAPSRTLNGRALLLITPHPEFYFRSEMHVQSSEGLDCYGAVTWGQFFVYQGFNERVGWGHTTSGADAVDEYAETVIEHDGSLFYRYGDDEKPIETFRIDIQYRHDDGSLINRRFTAYRTHHGPIIRAAEGKWISMALMYKPVEALTQSFLRMKVRDYEEFISVSELKANSVANTVYADADGNIAYWPPQFMPRRDDRFDFSLPVDGADPCTRWLGEHSLAELPYVLNPINGWIQNTNDSPYFAAGPCSPKSQDFPRYMDTAGRSARGVNAERVLNECNAFTLTSLVKAAYDPYLSAFARLIPAVIAAYDQLQPASALRTNLADQIETLRRWDFRHSVDSIATTLAVHWGEQIMRDVEASARSLQPEIGAMFDYQFQGRLSATLTFRAMNSIFDFIIENTSSEEKLAALAKASDQLVNDFGSWRTPWGDINRYQRLSGDIVPQFDDSQASTPIALTSSTWGSLACFKARRGSNTRRRYGVSGAGFVAAVEFGEKVRALAISPGGASSHRCSVHFNDQAARFATGDLREVYFYADHLKNHTETEYHPGE